MKKYDVIVIGGGPAGLNAGIFSVRRDMKTLLIMDPGSPATVTEATMIDDWLGSPTITGPELMKKFEEHANRLKVPMVRDKVKDIEKAGDGFKVIGEMKSFSSKTVIIATGAQHRKAQIKGEEKFAGKGVSYCANCDGPLFKGKKVMVIGGGDTAATYALLLNKIGADTTLIHRRDELRAVEIYRKQLEHSRVNIMWSTIPKEIKGGPFVKSVVVQNVKTKKLKELPMDGVFIAIGSVPMAEMTKNIGVKVDETGYIKVDRKQMTNVPGVFAAGDCCNNLSKRIITAASDGSVAAEMVYEYLQEKELG